MVMKLALEKGLKKVGKATKGYRPKLGSEGYVIEAMSAGQETKNNVIIDGEAYHAHAIEKLDPYERVSVVGYKTKHLKLIRQIPIRTIGHGE